MPVSQCVCVCVREREREREREPAAGTRHHHVLSCFPTHNGGVTSYMAKTFPGL